MMIYFLIVIISFLNVVLLLRLIIWFSKKYKYYDRNDPLKSKNQNISRLGGIGLFLAFIMVFIFFIQDLDESPGHSFYIAISLLFFLGLYDDVFDVKAYVKFIIQILIAALVVTQGQVKYAAFIFDSLALNTLTGNLFTVLLLVYVVNAFNLIDGIDGLAAMLGLVINLFLGLALALDGDLLYAVMAFVLFSTLCGFLLFNFPPAKIFMGDTGAMVIGFISAVVALRYIELNREVFNTIYTASVLVIALFIIPLYDTVRVFFIRLRLKRSPFIGDQNHIHHRLRRLGLQDYQIVLLLTFYTLLMVFAVMLLHDAGDAYLCVMLLITCILFNTVLDYQLRKRVASAKLN